MKSSVFVVLLLFALVPLIHGTCWHDRVKAGATHCQDFHDKTWHPIGSTWTNGECSKCSCSTEGQQCCLGWPMGVSGGCTIEYDYKTCTYKMIDKDPSIPCSAVGK